MIQAAIVYMVIMLQTTFLGFLLKLEVPEHIVLAHLIGFVLADFLALVTYMVFSRK